MDLEMNNDPDGGGEAMNCRTWASMIGICLALFWNQEAETKPLPVVQITIVEDGSSHVVPELVSLVQQEIRELTRREFDVRCPDDLKLQGGWSALRPAGSE